MNTENLSKNLGIIAAGLLIVNLALDLYDRFSSRKNEKEGQSKNEDAQSDENSNNDEGTQDKREEDNNH